MRQEFGSHAAGKGLNRKGLADELYNETPECKIGLREKQELMRGGGRL